MKINIEGIKLLEKIFEDNYLNYDTLIKFTKSKGTKGFIDHEKSFNRDISKSKIIAELIKLEEDNEYKDIYDFYILRENVSRLKEALLYIDKNGEMIINESLSKVYNFIPKNIKIQPNIYLYAGGIDGGFTVYRKDIFINYIKYFNNLEEFTKVISHELFHCRLVSLNNKFKNLFIDNINNRHTYEILGKILEEGTACLIQHGSVLEKDDPIGTITKEKMKLIGKKFSQLNYILLGIREGNINYLEMEKLDIYSLGYYIASSLYNFYGKEILLPWIEKYDYKKPIKSYIQAMRQTGNNSGFTKEIEGWLLQL